MCDQLALLPLIHFPFSVDPFSVDPFSIFHFPFSGEVVRLQ